MVKKAGSGKDGPIRVVFFGTPHFAAIVLKILVGWPGGEVITVITQPDRQSGRGNKVKRGDCAALADELDIPLYQPASLRNEEAFEYIKNLRPDLMVVAAYGLVIPGNILDLPKLGTINVHASLLPKYRGAAPIARAIIENWQDDATTGVSIMQVVEALDAGAVYATKEVPIGKNTHQSLTDILARAGGELLLITLDEIVAGKAKAIQQDDSLASYAKKLAKEDGLIDWTKKAEEIEAQIRGTYPWPCAHCTFELANNVKIPLLIYEAIVDKPCPNIIPGSIYKDKESLKVACGDKWLRIARLCKPGKKETVARDFINGHLRDLPQGICGIAY